MIGVPVSRSPPLACPHHSEDRVGHAAPQRLAAGTQPANSLEYEPPDMRLRQAFHIEDRTVPVPARGGNASWLGGHLGWDIYCISKRGSGSLCQTGNAHAVNSWEPLR